MIVIVLLLVVVVPVFVYLLSAFPNPFYPMSVQSIEIQDVCVRARALQEEGYDDDEERRHAVRLFVQINVNSHRDPDEGMVLPLERWHNDVDFICRHLELMT